MIQQLSGFENIVKMTIIDKSSVLTLMLSIEIFFFSKRNNLTLQSDNMHDLVNMSTSPAKQNSQDQLAKWIKNNHEFGKALDKTRDFTDRRYEKKPSIKTNIDTDERYLDKTKFLMKFSAFDGYMQYIDKAWDTPCQGIDLLNFKKKCELIEAGNNRKSERAYFYDNYTKQEQMVDTIDCGGYTNQPICLYDFTVKNLQHDCLIFSTRHM